MRKALLGTLYLMVVLIFWNEVTLVFAQTGKPIGEIKKVTEGKNIKEEVNYPTDQVAITRAHSTENVKKRKTPLEKGNAILTRDANTFVEVEGKDKGFFYPNTYITLDGINSWLVKYGGMFIVNKKGKLDLIAEGLATIFVRSEIYLSVAKEESLRVYVFEGNVRLENEFGSAALGKSEAGRVIKGSAPEKIILPTAELLRIKNMVTGAKGVFGKPFYKTWWFWGAVGGAIGGTVAALVGSDDGGPSEGTVDITGRTP